MSLHCMTQLSAIQKHVLLLLYVHMHMNKYSHKNMSGHMQC